MQKKNKKKLLLHICCAGCGAFVGKTLKDDYDVTLFFYNPNLFPENEQGKRLDEVIRIANKFQLELIVGDYDHQNWLSKVEGMEKEKEKGPRCFICYEDRLEKTFKKAQEVEADCFTTTLTVSPHKIAQKIFEIGNRLSQKGNVEFLEIDFKKKNGFQKSIELSKELEIYRQNYCGCEFSMR